MNLDARKTVLVVEDDPAVRRMLGVVLRHHGFAVRLAASGAEAVAAYRENGNKFSLVLLDVQMPGQDGPRRSPSCGNSTRRCAAALCPDTRAGTPPRTY